MCAIYMLGVEMQYVGGASLIAPNKLLTVAHKAVLDIDCPYYYKKIRK